MTAPGPGELLAEGTPPGFRSGFVCIVGRPNVGKSTLLNRILGQKIAIISDRPQTTRNAIRGVLTTDQAQVVFVDTPGLHKPRTVLGERLNRTVRATLKEVDAVILVLDASEPIGKGDAFIAGELGGVGTPVVVALNKVDRVDRRHLQAQLEVARRLCPPPSFVDVVPVSALHGAGVGDLVEAVVRVLPEGPLYYPRGVVTDQPERQLIAELVREKALELTREEVPHSVAVVVEEVQPGDREDTVEVDAVVYVERESQKGILIGKGGRMLKEIGSRARREIEALLGSHVYLRLRVKVERDWQKRAALIDRFGYGQ